MPTKVFNVDDSGFGEGDAHALPSVLTADVNKPPQSWSGILQIMGEVFKSAIRYITYNVYDVDIPKGATIRRATVERVLGADTTNTLDIYRVALLDPSPTHSRPIASEDGLHGGVANWVIKDATRNTETVWSDQEAIGEVYDNAPAATGDGPASGASGGQVNWETDFGFGTFGAAWTASSTYTLGQIRLRISRTASTPPDYLTVGDTDGNTSRPATNLFIEVYNVISATDRRPTGPVIATSDAFPWDNLKIGGAPGTDQNTWAIFTFTGGPSIASGSIHAYKLVEGAGNVLPLGFPLVRTAFRSDATNTTAAGIFWGVGGFSISSYPHLGVFPNPSENQPGGPLVAGRCFGDDECIVPLGTVHTPPFPVAAPLVWGHDLDAGPGIDFPLDGTGASTIDFVALIQKWIDDPGYVDTGTRTAIIMDLLSGTDDLLFSFDSQEDPNNPGMVLRVTYDDPIFTVRAVEKRVAIFPAEARVCAPDAEVRDFAFPETGKRTRTFDFEDRTARLPKNDRDKEFC